MSAISVSGKDLAARVKEELKPRVERVSQRLGRPVCLAVVLVGEDPASQVYVGSKGKAAKEVGMVPRDFRLAHDATQHELEHLLATLSSDPTVDGILLQLPLPKHLNEFEALQKIVPEKDVDGLTPLNQGLLQRGERCFEPCTPKGCVMLIQEALHQLERPTDMSGLSAVVIGRSILVGKPMATLLLQQNATVTLCHSRTRGLEDEIARADIVVAAIGRANLVKGSWLKPGCIVIDVGMNRTEAGKLVGDVEFSEALSRAAAITPVPGGVGPMTIAMLITNTVESAERKVSV